MDSATAGGPLGYLLGRGDQGDRTSDALLRLEAEAAAAKAAVTTYYDTLGQLLRQQASTAFPPKIKGATTGPLSSLVAPTPAGRPRPRGSVASTQSLTSNPPSEGPAFSPDRGESDGNAPPSARASRRTTTRSRRRRRSCPLRRNAPRACKQATATAQAPTLDHPAGPKRRRVRETITPASRRPRRRPPSSRRSSRPKRRAPDHNVHPEWVWEKDDDDGTGANGAGTHDDTSGGTAPYNLRPNRRLPSGFFRDLDRGVVAPLVDHGPKPPAPSSGSLSLSSSESPGPPTPAPSDRKAVAAPSATDDNNRGAPEEPPAWFVSGADGSWPAGKELLDLLRHRTPDVLDALSQGEMGTSLPTEPSLLRALWGAVQLALLHVRSPAQLLIQEAPPRPLYGSHPFARIDLGKLADYVPATQRRGAVAATAAFRALPATPFVYATVGTPLDLWRAMVWLAWFAGRFAKVVLVVVPATSTDEDRLQATVRTQPLGLRPDVALPSDAQRAFSRLCRHVGPTPALRAHQWQPRQVLAEVTCFGRLLPPASKPEGDADGAAAATEGWRLDVSVAGRRFAQAVDAFLVAWGKAPLGSWLRARALPIAHVGNTPAAAQSHPGVWGIFQLRALSTPTGAEFRAALLQ